MALRNVSRMVVSGLVLVSGLCFVGCGGGGYSAPMSTYSGVAPSITTQPAGQTVLEGATATFTVVASGTAPLSYQWNKGMTPITGATFANYTTPAAVMGDSGSSFTVTVSNAAGNITSSAAMMTVRSNPVIASFTALPATVAAGSSATLAFSFSGGTGSIDNNVGPVTSGINATVTPTGTTTYTLTVDNGYGTRMTGTATVTVTAVTPPPPTSPAQVSLGDAPADWIMAFGMTVNSISLTTSGGTSVNLVSTPTPMEMMQTMATMQPISALNVPQGTYTQATVTVSSISMGYLDPVSHAYTQKTMAGPFTAHVPFSPAMTVGSSPLALNFDMDMASSVSIDGLGSVTFNPVMTAAMASVSSGTPDPFQGGMQHLVGSVSSTSGSTFTMGSMMGIQTTTFTTNGSTQFPSSGLTGMGMMGSGMMVAVDAMMQADGSYLAQRVDYMGTGSSGMMGGGLVTSITGNPPTQLTMVANGGQGNGMMASFIAGTITVSLPASVSYTIDSDEMVLTGLPFTPAFDSTSLALGQRVEVVSNGGMMMAGGLAGGQGAITASQVRLEQQGLHGAVLAYSTSGSQPSFTLTLPTDSVFTSLTGAASIQVYEQANTQLQGLTALANGTNVQVRGLLFDDAGSYRLVASVIEPGAAVTVTPPASGSTSMQVGLGDAPSDWLMAFGMTVNSISLMNSGGTWVNVMPAAAPMEMMQTMATMQPISAPNVPQGTYSQATVTLSSVSMGYMDPVSHAYKQKTMPGPFSTTVLLNPAMTVGTTPMALNFDMNMASSVSIDGSGNVTITPTMTAMMSNVSGTANPWQGGMQHQVGRVSSLSGSEFTMGSMMGIQTTIFTTNGSTQFPTSGLTGMGMMGSGMLVAVDATLQADGSYLAQRVEYMGTGSAGMMGGGLVTTLTGNPPTQLTLVANGGMGGGMMASSIAGTITVALPTSVLYSFDIDEMDLNGLPFTPAFGPTSLVKGQKVEVVSASSMMGGGMMGGSGTLTASQVRLEQQALHGVVSAYTVSGTQATFTLTPSSDSAFTAITGATTIQVYQQVGTQLHGLTAIANGADVQVRGLLFYDAGAYKLVSSWITAH